MTILRSQPSGTSLIKCGGRTSRQRAPTVGCPTIVNYNIQTKTPTEWNVGCEKCHGPGGAHVAQPSRTNIVNPVRLDPLRARDTCIQCHSQGRPVTPVIDGKAYDWPVGFHMGMNLADYWILEDHKLGETSFTHYPDGTAHKNRMQGNDFVTSVMYTRGVTCFSCHDVHGTGNNADLLKPAQMLCLECHGPKSPNGRTPRRSSSTRITRRVRAAASASAATCPKSSRPSRT